MLTNASCSTSSADGCRPRMRTRDAEQVRVRALVHLRESVVVAARGVGQQLLQGSVGTHPEKHRKPPQGLSSHASRALAASTVFVHARRRQPPPHRRSARQPPHRGLARRRHLASRCRRRTPSPRRWCCAGRWRRSAAPARPPPPRARRANRRWINAASAVVRLDGDRSCNARQPSTRCNRIGPRPSAQRRTDFHQPVERMRQSHLRRAGWR